MDASSVPIGELLPHGPAMTLIDRLVTYDAARSVAVARITQHNAFFDGSSVPAWVGIEYMAQTIAAHAGFAARLLGMLPAVGFILGTRAYASFVDEFAVGSQLTITVEPQVLDAGFAAFDCAISIDRLVATAILRTYEPTAAELARFRQQADA